MKNILLYNSHEYVLYWKRTAVGCVHVETRRLRFRWKISRCGNDLSDWIRTVDQNMVGTNIF
jgi:hypothetical protein